MKSMSVLRWVTLVSVSVLGACGGVTDNIGSGNDGGKGGTGNTGTGANGKGAESMGAQSSGASSSTGATGNIAGKDPGPGPGGMGPGVGGTGPNPGGMCKSDMDCTNPVAPCEPCADGGFACTKNVCAAGKCTVAHDMCETKCMTDKECPVLDVACTKCMDGGMACPMTHCLKGTCQTTVPGCPGTEPCQGLACGTACKACGPDGMCDSNELSYCNADGKCAPGLPQCGNPGMCKTVKDCGAPPPMCVACGNDTCAKFDCIANKCVFACPPNPNPQCKVSEDCPVLDDCKMCGSGKCAVQACLQGSCSLVCPVID